ncbi:MAG TPA: ATP-binding cassette domain-containing protein [Candidatus Methylacidiphilales bacterium]
MTDVLVELEAVGKTFPPSKIPAVDTLSTQVRVGQITGLVGPDGAGKTTLMRLMCGLMVPTKGSILVQGLQPVRDAAKLRDVIGYMPQKFGLYEDLTVQENLNFHADLRNVVGDDREKTFRRLLEMTDLAKFTDRLAGKLSGGMKQKLGLASALLGHPKLLLLDEPGVGVDPISRRELWKLVRDLVKDGIAVVWSTAYLDEAELCDHVLLMNEGKLLYHGTPGDLTSRIRGRCFQLREIAGSRRQVLTRILSRPEVLDGVIQGQSIRLVLQRDAKRPDLAELNAGPAAHWTEATPRFEDAFLDILHQKPLAKSPLAEHLQDIEKDGSTVIEAEHLTKKFGDFAATDDVTFKVARGEIFGLLGPNGAGKSTTFKMMCGLLQPTSGKAEVTGIDLKTSAAAARQHLGYMAQKFSLYGNLTVQQNLLFFSGAYGLDGKQQKEEVESMVKSFHLQPYLNSKADGLPLGFKQRLALACAVMHGPDILFLDEPTSGVDPVTRREFWTHINSVVEKGVTVMITTHFMDEAEYCDRVGLVFRGRLIATGTPDELKKMAATEKLPEPGMEDAFIELVTRNSEEND